MSRERDVHERMVELADRILQRTLESGIRWVETDVDDQYLYPASTSGVLIERREDYNEGISYQLTLLNDDGKAVQELHQGTERDEAGDPAPASWNETLERLFDAARREALGIDSLLDKTLKDIDQGVTKTERVRKAAARADAGSFDDPWATAVPATKPKPKPTSSFDDEPPF